MIATPKVVIFKDIEVDYIYSVAIIIRTISAKPKLIRLIKPKTSEFTIEYNKEEKKASGMILKVFVKFESN